MQELEYSTGYKWRGQEGLWNMKGDMKISNATIIVKKYIKYRNNLRNTYRSEITIVYLYSSGNESDEIIISEEELTNGKFIEKKPIEVMVYMKFSRKIVDIYRLLIQEQLLQIQVEEKIEYEHGWNDKEYYWKGEEGIRLLSNSTFDFYKNAMIMATLIGESEYIAGTVLAAIHGPLRRILNEADISHNFVTYLVGETGVGKTDVAKKISNYHPQINTFLSLNSDKKLLKKSTLLLRDMTLLIDDMCMSASTRVKERQLDIMSEIIQNASDSGSLLVEGIESTVESGNIHLLVTSEKLIDNFSTLNRCFLIQMEEKLSDEVWNVMNTFSKEGRMCEFMKHFLSWVQDNYDVIVQRMRVNYEEYLIRTKTKLWYEVPGIERIRNTVAVQLTLGKCLKDYFSCVQIDETVLNFAGGTLNRCAWSGGVDVCTHISNIKNKKNRLQYLPVLAELIGQIGNGVWIASSEKIYYKYLNKKGREGKCIGVCLNKGYWSFNPQRMSELIADELCVESISPKSIGQELKYYSLAHIDNERKISCRWHSEKRMYHVRVKELVELIYPEQNIAIEVERRVNECLDF